MPSLRSSDSGYILGTIKRNEIVLVEYKFQ